MPIERLAVSALELADSLGVAPKRFIAIERDKGERGTRKADRSKWWILLEPEDANKRNIPPVD